MLKDNFELMYKKLRLDFYKKVFAKIKQSEGLNTSDIICAEIIYLLEHPTIKEFAEFISVSQPNATYKIKNLIEKGYIIKVSSTEDKREAYLATTDKFYKDFMNQKAYGSFILDRLEKLNNDEIRTINKAIDIVNRKIMIKKDED